MNRMKLLIKYNLIFKLFLFVYFVIYIKRLGFALINYNFKYLFKNNI